MMLYQDGSLRIVVHTGNLIESDWQDRTQGMWISPACPSLLDSKEETSKTGFKKDLLRYLQSYSLPALQHWMDKIRSVDMSAIK